MDVSTSKLNILDVTDTLKKLMEITRKGFANQWLYWQLEVTVALGGTMRDIDGEWTHQKFRENQYKTRS